MDLAPPEFEFPTTTVWSFPERGSWATHKGDYRGNFSPYIPRNVILRYSKEGELVLDPMCGSGTSLIECKLLNRDSLGIDINSNAVELAKNRLSFPKVNESRHLIKVGDARDTGLSNDFVDLVILHPPYLDIIKYAPDNNSDISNIHDIEPFISEMSKVAKEAYRVLKPGKFCAVLIGDTRRKGYYIPLSMRVLNSFLEAGFALKEDVIKRQWNCKTTGFWNSKSRDFLLIMHEHLFVFKK